MKPIVQDAQHPSEILFAFDDLVDTTMRELRWAVAYTTKQGVERVVERIVGRVGESRWGAAAKALVTCFDYGLTDPDGLAFLGDLGVSIRIANPDVLDSPNLRPRQSFHPKLYLCRGASISALIGSANLTNSAMTCNTEAALLYPNAPTDLWDAGWKRIIEKSVELSPALLAKYRDTRCRTPSEPPNLDDVPPPTPVRVRSLSTFWDAVESRRLTPAAFNNLWVEAGSMSSGGSKSQLESPRGANRFFGFAFNNYNDNHALIGYPTLTALNRRWTNRPLTWHGDNRMERLNLPTLAQGGFVYARTAILFRRNASGFELAVAPWDDSLAVSWRNASHTIGHIYRLGASSNRSCGVF